MTHNCISSIQSLYFQEIKSKYKAMERYDSIHIFDGIMPFFNV